MSRTDAYKLLRIRQQIGEVLLSLTSVEFLGFRDAVEAGVNPEQLMSQMARLSSMPEWRLEDTGQRAAWLRQRGTLFTGDCILVAFAARLPWAVVRIKSRTDWLVDLVDAVPSSDLILLDPDVGRWLGLTSDDSDLLAFTGTAQATECVD